MLKKICINLFTRFRHEDLDVRVNGWPYAPLPAPVKERLRNDAGMRYELSRRFLPAYEDLLVSDFSTYSTHRSQLIPDKTFMVQHFFCPRCRKEIEEPPHCVEVRTRCCGLKLRAAGNSLRIYRS